MTAWTVAAGLVGALIGVVGKGYFDFRTGRSNRLLDEKLKHAVKFFEKADKLRRSSQSRLVATMSLDNARHGDEKTFEYYRTQVEERTKESVEVFAEAEDAYNALRLLLPTAAEAARRYLDLCNAADPYPDDDKASRESARSIAEQAIRSALKI